MNEARIQAYLKLTQELLQCPSGEEPDILNANRELIDSGLISTMNQVAAMLAENGEENRAEFLRQMAGHLGEILGLTAEEGAATPQAYLEFLAEVLQAEYESNDQRVVYPILQRNQDKLDRNFARTLQTWATENLAAANPEEAETIAALIENFSIDISNFPLGRRIDNLEIAITGYEIVSSVYTREAFPEFWAMTQNNLAAAYSDRIEGSRAQNLEDAIAAYHLALDVYTRKAFPEYWAMTQNNLAAAYCQRIKGSRAQNLESAIAACNNALDVYTREAFPEYWADAQIILANAYCQRIKGSRAQNLESAIAAYTSALSVYTREAFPEQWAMTQNNLAIAYSNRIFGSRAENIEKAIAAYTSALSVYTREAFPEDWAMTQNNLANAYQNRIRGSRAKNLESAIRGYRAALEIRTPTAYPINCLTTGRNLGNLGYNNDNWELAIEGYTPAIAAVEQSRDWATSPDTKQKLIEDALGVYNRLIQAYLQTNQLQPALKTVERSKSRYLVELLNNAELFPKNATAAQKQQLRQLRREIATLEQTLAQDGSDANISPETDSDSRSHSQPATSQQPTNPNREELQTKLHQLNQLLDEIGDDEFNLTQRVEIDFNLATLLDTETAILEWYIGESRFYTFIITHDSIHCLEHSESDLEKLIAWGNTYLNDYGEKSWNSALAPRLTALSEILNLSQVLEKIPATCSKLILIPHRYLHLFPLHALPVNASCHSQLICYSEPKRPSSFSQSNIAFSVAESDHKNLYLLDCFGGGVSYAPSCQLLQLLQTRKRPDAPKRPFFAIQNPTEDLRYTDIEVETIEKKFDPRYILKRKEANKLAFDDATTLENLRRSYYAHFSCHGAFNPESPLDSALILAGAMEMQAEPGVEVPPRSEETSDSGEMQAEPGVEVPPQSEGTSGEREVTLRDGRKAKTGESLTLREIFAKLELPGCRLVTLSACETGLISFDKLTDEYIGLPSGFLYAGSTNVVSSLWCVDDFATAFLMIRFYENLSTASSITLALNQAQMWLRDATQRELQNWVETLRLDATSQNTIQEFFSWIQPELKPFSEPQYWAAFCAIGQ